MSDIANMTIGNLVDNALHEKIKKLEIELQGRDYKIEALTEENKTINKKLFWSLTKLKQISDAFKDLEDQSCFYINEEDKIYLSKGIL